MEQNYSIKTINDLFIQKLNSPEGLTKVAEEGGNFVRKKLREVSFARQIMPPQFVTRDELQRSVNHDGLVKIVDIEPDSRAMTVNFRGAPNSEYVVGERFEIPLFNISSPEFQKTEEELLAYEMPLTDVIEKNSVLDVQKIEDESFLGQMDSAIDVEEAISSGSKKITGTYNTDDTIKKSDFKKLFDTLDGDKLKSGVVLMDTTMFNRLFLYDSTTVGDSVASDTFVNGYNGPTLFSRRLVVSNKTDLLNNKIYVFTDPSFLGQFLILNDTKFWIDKRKNIITWSIYETLGTGVGNTKAVGRLDLS